MTATTPVRQTLTEKPENHGDLATLRQEAKELGINSYGMGRAALRASIDAVRKALENQPKPAETQTGNDDVLTDDLGEPLGPNNIERIPMGTRARRLIGDTRPGYYRYWFNDVPGRIERARRAGYEHVKDSTGQPLSIPAGTLQTGGGMRQYLMELPMKLRDQDLARKRTVNDDIDKMLNRGKVAEKSDDNRYIPDQGISITRR